MHKKYVVSRGLLLWICVQKVIKAIYMYMRYMGSKTSKRYVHCYYESPTSISIESSDVHYYYKDPMLTSIESTCNKSDCHVTSALSTEQVCVTLSVSDYDGAMTAGATMSQNCCVFNGSTLHQ